VSRDVQEAKLLVMIQPVYPPVAKAARVQGTVRLSATINREGKITELKVLEGHPLLTAAACAVVEKWRYRPTLLDGEPVEVATEIIVNFRLI
jgi:protein TonB